MGKDIRFNDDGNVENDDNITKYGEQVCSEFVWLPLNKQKKNADKFDKMTKKKK